MDWQPIETAPPPENVPLVLCAKPESHVWWKFGVGEKCHFGFVDWPWAFPPTHWKLLDAPDGGYVCVGDSLKAIDINREPANAAAEK